MEIYRAAARGAAQRASCSGLRQRISRRIVVEVTNDSLPRRVIFHRQAGVNLTSLGFHPRAIRRWLGHHTQVVPLLACKGQRRRTQRHVLREGGCRAYAVGRAVLEQRQPLCAVHRRHIQLHARRLRQWRNSTAVRGPDSALKRELFPQQPAAIEMIIRPHVAGQIKAVQIPIDVELNRQ